MKLSGLPSEMAFILLSESVVTVAALASKIKRSAESFCIVCIGFYGILNSFLFRVLSIIFHRKVESADIVEKWIR